MPSADTVTAAEQTKQRIIRAVLFEDLPDSARSVIARMVSLAATTESSDKTRGAVLADYYAALEALFDAEQ